MLKSLARTAGFLAYFFITLEMLFMVTPFALYYYSAYAPLLSAPSNFPAAAWLPAFFLPHLSTEIVPSIGGLVFLSVWSDSWWAPFRFITQNSADVAW
jgi:hypothetical protein